MSYLFPTMVLALAVNLVLSFMFLIVVFFKYDSVIKSLYKRNKRCWEELGRPMGFFWVPPEVSTLNPFATLARSSSFRAIILSRKPPLPVLDDEAANKAWVQARYFYWWSKFLLLLFFFDAFLFAAILIIIK